MSTCNLPNFQASLLARINQVRASGADCGSHGAFGAAPPLAWNDRLAVAADGHSEDMSARNYFSHTSADGRTLAERVNAAGYAWSSLGENIAAGYPTANAVMDGWIASPGHCANLMNTGFAEVGVACVPGAAGDTYSTYWTMDLGRPR
ncbi:MAG: CAP domain-containing protein [Caldimonas sp.]